MVENNTVPPLLNLHFDGPAIHDGRILLDDLLQSVSNLGSAVERVVNVLETGAGIRIGRPPKAIQLFSALELVATTRGSFGLGLDLRRPHPLLPEFDVGEKALGQLVAGLPQVARDGPLPAGFDDGVLMALREAGRVFDRGIDSVSLNLRQAPDERHTVFVSETRDRLVSRLKRFQQAWATIEGRLLMADLDEKALRCRLHPSTGRPIFCSFPESLTATVMRHLRGFVQARGEASIERATGQVRSLTILDLEPIEGLSLEGQQVVSSSFWEARSFEELAQEQGVYPVTDWEQIAGGWPEDASFDNFLDAIKEARRG